MLYRRDNKKQRNWHTGSILCRTPRKISLHKKLYLIGVYGEGVSKNLKDIIETSDFIILKQVPRKEIVDSFQDIDTFIMPYNPNVNYLNMISPTLFQNLVIFAFLNWKSKFVRRIRSPIKINIRYLKTSSQKYNRKDCNRLQNLVIFNFTFITGFWYWVHFLNNLRYSECTLRFISNYNIKFSNH